MNDKDSFYTIVFGFLGLFIGSLGKAKLGLSITSLAIISCAIGIAVCILTSMFCVKGVHKMYQPGRRDIETGRTETLEIPIAIYHDWYSPVLNMQCYLFPLNTILGSMLYLLYRTVI